MTIGDRLVRVKWLDAVGSDGWSDPTDVVDIEPLTCIDVGFIVAESVGALTITPCIAFDDGEVHKLARHITIPRGCIISVEDI